MGNSGALEAIHTNVIMGGKAIHVNTNKEKSVHVKI